MLHARCACGSAVVVNLSALTSSPSCTCGRTATQAVAEGPHASRLARRTGYAGAPVGVVYFARLGNVIKIGTTTNLWQRMQALGGPEVLGVLDGGLVEERRMHAKFHHLRLTGEWFCEADEIHDHIRAHCRQPAPRKPSTHVPDPAGLARRQMQDT